MSSFPSPQSPQARWQIVAQPGALPACCFMCNAGASTREWFVDTTLQFEFHGAVYICNECLAELAGSAGWMPPAVGQGIAQKYEEVRQENFRLRRQMAALSDLERSVVDFVEFRNADRASGGGWGNAAAQLHVVEDERISHPALADGAGGSQGSEEPVGTGEGAAFEPSDDERMVNIRSDDKPAPDFRLGF